MRDMNLNSLEKRLDFTIKNPRLFREALTHRSYLNERPDWPEDHNERLEYLGDAVLELIVSENLFHRFPHFPEGQLTVLRAALVNYQMLARIALRLDLEELILMSRGEARDTKKAKETILANALEAVIGAVYLDQGLERTRKVVENLILTHLDDVLKTKSYRDPKSEFQELIQEKLKLTPTYRVLGESGPAHEKTFTIGVYLDDELVAEGRGSSKQEGEIEAAKKALLRYRK